MKNSRDISFRLVSYTDAAGKYSPDAFRSGNEDNFYVDADLADEAANGGEQDEILRLGRLGMLMVVADGMGGMNAGEVASQIAVDTVKASFKAESLTDSVVSAAQSRQKYLERVIREADRNIKKEARKDRGKEGMGSTIMMAWLFNDELTISWCGDSRAYIFNEKSGLRLISQDHSYVQELVNKGLLTYDQTFDHPQNNIITRSLGDPTKEARPESKTLKIGRGDIILLCSDGLSGVLRDRKTYDANGQLLPEENIEDIVRAHTSSMKECREALWAAAERGDWYDNVTAILCQITDGPESPWAKTPVEPGASNDDNGSKGNTKKRTLLFVGLGVLIAGAIAGAFFLGRGSHDMWCGTQEANDSVVEEPADSVKAEVDTVPQAKTEPNVQKPAEATTERPTVEERIKEQANGKEESATTSGGLTKIEKSGEKTDMEVKSEDKNSTIKDNIRNSNTGKSQNPLTPKNPVIPKKDKDNNHKNSH